MKWLLKVFTAIFVVKEVCFTSFSKYAMLHSLENAGRFLWLPSIISKIGFRGFLFGPMFVMFLNLLI